jgi:hypothetical protein
MIVDTIMESKDATFFENIFPMRQTSSSLENVDVVILDFPRCEQVENIPPREDDDEEDDNLVITPCRSKRQRSRNPSEMTLLYTLWMTCLRL